MINIGGQNGAFNPKVGDNTCQCSKLIEEVWGFSFQNHTHTSKKRAERVVTKENEDQLHTPEFHVSHKSEWCPWSWQNGWHCLYGGWLPLLPFGLPYTHPLKLCQRHWWLARCRFQTLGGNEKKHGFELLNVCLGMLKNHSSEEKKHPEVSFFKRILNIYPHLLFLPFVFLLMWISRHSNEIQRWFISEAIVSSSFLGVPNSLAQCMFSRGDLSLYVMASWCRDSTKNGLVLKALDSCSHCHHTSGRFHEIQRILLFAVLCNYWLVVFESFKSWN